MEKIVADGLQAAVGGRDGASAAGAGGPATEVVVGVCDVDGKDI